MDKVKLSMQLVMYKVMKENGYLEERMEKDY